MEQIVEKKTSENRQEKQPIAPKKKFTILGYSVWRLIAYFATYSVLGFAIETTFGALTKGVIESRKSFLYGPFCGIYGIGAIVMILFLQYFRKNNYTLFFGGFLVGSIVEYVISWIGEMIFHVKWWDYSDIPFNLNGRICVFFSLFWGILAIYLMSHVHPKVDELIDKIKQKVRIKTLKTVTILALIFFIFDSAITGFALKMFYTRLTIEHNLDIQGVERYADEYETLYKKPKVKKVVDTFFNDKKMLKTFPNLKLTASNGDIIYVNDVLHDIQPYYVRIFTPRIPKAILPQPKE